MAAAAEESRSGRKKPGRDPSAGAAASPDGEEKQIHCGCLREGEGQPPHSAGSQAQYRRCAHINGSRRITAEAAEAGVCVAPVRDASEGRSPLTGCAPKYHAYGSCGRGLFEEAPLKVLYIPQAEKASSLTVFFRENSVSVSVSPSKGPVLFLSSLNVLNITRLSCIPRIFLNHCAKTAVFLFQRGNYFC